MGSHVGEALITSTPAVHHCYVGAVRIIEAAYVRLRIEDDGQRGLTQD